MDKKQKQCKCTSRRGRVGPRGKAGKRGPQGDIGHTGPIGPQGATGKDGLPADATLTRFNKAIIACNVALLVVIGIMSINTY